MYPGKSLARQDNQIIFLDQGLPGEIVSAKIISRHKNYSRAKVTKIIQPAKQRVAPRCGHYQACSVYQYVDYHYQLELKKSQLQEMLARYLGLAPEVTIKASPQVWGYRNKANLTILRADGKAGLAYCQPRSAVDFFQLDQCFLLPEAVNRLNQAALELVRRDNLDFVFELTTRINRKTQLFLLLHCRSLKNPARLQQLVRPLAERFPVVGIACAIEEKPELFQILGAPWFSEQAAGLEFRFGPRSFFQINTVMLEELIADLRADLDFGGTETLVDLYSGVGVFALLLPAKKVTAVEIAEENAVFLRENIRFHQRQGITVQESPSEYWAENFLTPDVDVLIVDPPRQGLDPKVCQKILQYPPQRLVYISCDPATLLRDVKILLSQYQIQKITAYDFFPHTPHIETCLILQRLQRS